MSYVGGKSKGAEHILAILNDPAFDGKDYCEPFVGYAHILRRVEKKSSCRASDVNGLLIMLLKAVQEGTELPTVTRERYAQLKAAKDDISLERAVAAFQYSFQGKEFGGFVQNYVRRNGKVDDIPASRAHYYAKLRDNPTFRTTEITQCGYQSLTPTNMLIYCDPPYRNTTGYSKSMGPFDHDAFWRTMRSWSATN